MLCNVKHHDTKREINFIIIKKNIITGRCGEAMVKIISSIEDKKIKTTNYLIELTFEEYLNFARDIISKNMYQRKRVRSSTSIYSQLREDLKKGCVIPPIVLAIDKLDMEKEKFNDSNSQRLLKDSMILDGLQRTLTLIDADNEVQLEDEEGYREFLDNKLRVEVYGGINRFGILYRMLTLNTGQTPMTLRHQIEILYSSYDLKIKDIKLIKEVDGKVPKQIGEYKFQDIIDGFISYLQVDYLPMTRSTVLETITALESIASENINDDLFRSFVNSYYLLSKKMLSDLPESEIDKMKEMQESDKAFRLGAENLKTFLFAENVFSLMSKSQVMTGFGSGIALLKQRGKISSISDIIKYINEIKNGGKTPYDWFKELNRNLYEIKQHSSKIGNSQRMYFHEFFRLLFDNDDDNKESFLNLYESTKSARRIYMNKMGYE